MIQSFSWTVVLGSAVVPLTVFGGLGSLIKELPTPKKGTLKSIWLLGYWESALGRGKWSAALFCVPPRF